MKKNILKKILIVNIFLLSFISNVSVANVPTLDDLPFIGGLFSLDKLPVTLPNLSYQAGYIDHPFLGYTIQKVRISHRLRARYYEAIVPRNIQPDAPMVLFLHAMVSPHWVPQWLYFHRLRDLSATEGVVVVYPSGTLFTWNAGICCPPSSVLLNVDDVGFLKATIDDVSSRISATTSGTIDPSRVYVMGHSNGAAMAHSLAINATQKIAGIAPISYAFDESHELMARPSQAVPMIIQHAKNDSVHRWDGGLFLNIETPSPFLNSVEHGRDIWASYNGCGARERVQMEGAFIDTHNNCDQDTVIQLVGYDDGGLTGHMMDQLDVINDFSFLFGEGGWIDAVFLNNTNPDVLNFITDIASSIGTSSGPNSVIDYAWNFLRVIKKPGHTNSYMWATNELYRGEFLRSPDKSKRLEFTHDSNIVVKDEQNRKIWQSATSNSGGHRVKLHSSGDLALWSQARWDLVWKSGWFGIPYLWLEWIPSKVVWMLKGESPTNSRNNKLSIGDDGSLSFSYNGEVHKHIVPSPPSEIQTITKPRVVRRLSFWQRLLRFFF